MPDCPHCQHTIDDRLIQSWNGTICARRRKRLASDKAREMNLASQAAKREKKA